MQVDENDWTAEEREMEAALGRLSPAGIGLDRGAVLYEAGVAAGRVAARRNLWAWRTAACVGIGASVMIGMVLAAGGKQGGLPAAGMVAKTERPGTVPVQETGSRGSLPAWAERHAAARSVGNSPWEYGELRSAVLARGIEAMPASPNGEGGGPRTLRADGKSVRIQDGTMSEGGSL